MITGPGLKDAIKTAMLANGRNWTDYADGAWDVICGAIIGYLVANTQVVVSSVSLVTAGLVASGPGTGTIQ